MKYLRKYPFFFMILISSLLYGGVQLLGTGQNPEVQSVSVSQVSKENKAAESRKETQMIQQEESEQIQPSEEVAQLEKVPEEEIVPETSETVPGIEEEQEAPEAAPVPENARQTREFQRVEMDYLDDALFIGDSRTSTLYEYAGWENTDFFVKYGQSVWDVWENEMEGNTLENMLKSKQYGKIYIMLGVNELGTGTAESFAQQFAGIVAQVRQLQPDAVIFVESIMHVTASKDAENTHINNQEIDVRNEQLKLLADNVDIFYIDENEVMDEPGTGKMKEEYSFDGVHLKVKYIDVWREFILNHGIIK